MQLQNINGIITRQDGLPYDATKINGQWVLRATAGTNPVVIATANSMTDAMLMLVAQAPEDTNQLRINQITRLLNSANITEAEKVLLRKKISA